MLWLRVGSVALLTHRTETTQTCLLFSLDLINSFFPDLKSYGEISCVGELFRSVMYGCLFST